MSCSKPSFCSKIATKILVRLRGLGWLSYPTKSLSLVGFQHAMGWIFEHRIEGEGVTTDDSKTSVDIQATAEIVNCLKQWGEHDEAASLAKQLAARHLRSNGSLPVVTVDAGNDFVRAAKIAYTQGLQEEMERLLRAASFHKLRGGGLPGGAGSRRFCPLSTATAAWLWFAAGNWTEGEPLFQAVLKHLTRGGGFGAVVTGAVPNMQYAACVSAYLSALHFRLRDGFERTAPLFPETIPPEDGRFVVVEKCLKESEARCVIDVGCGKGRIIRLLRLRNPEIDAWAVDISTAMLKMLPAEIHVQVGSLLDSGLPDGAGDLVFCIEALEHAVNARAAVRELARITSPTGLVLIIDKCASRLGSMEICDWEQWFDADEVTSWLVEEGFRVEVQRGVFKPGEEGLDDRFLCWIARR